MPDSRVLCVDTCPFDRRKDEIPALTSRCAGLQKYEPLDTRATYLISAVFADQRLDSLTIIALNCGSQVLEESSMAGSG
jgi:hypothetical protein